MADLFERSIEGLQATDVFFDCGSGTGKIPILAALVYPGVRAVGIEFVAARHELAVQALAALSTITLALLLTLAAAARVPLTRETATLVVDLLHEAMPRVNLVCGDFLHAKVLTTATVVFVNNTVFEPALMINLSHVLAQLRHLRKLVVIKQLCPRHRDSCRGDCSSFAHPPQQHRCAPSWDAQVSLYVYDVALKAHQLPPRSSALEELAAIGVPASRGPLGAFTPAEEAELLAHWERTTPLGAKAARYRAVALAMGRDVERIRKKLLSLGFKSR